MYRPTNTEQITPLWLSFWYIMLGHEAAYVCENITKSLVWSLWTGLTYTITIAANVNTHKSWLLCGHTALDQRYFNVGGLFQSRQNVASTPYAYEVHRARSITYIFPSKTSRYLKAQASLERNQALSCIYHGGLSFSSMHIPNCPFETYSSVN